MAAFAAAGEPVDAIPLWPIAATAPPLEAVVERDEVERRIAALTTPLPPPGPAPEPPPPAVRLHGTETGTVFDRVAIAKLSVITAVDGQPLRYVGDFPDDSKAPRRLSVRAPDGTVAEHELPGGTAIARLALHWDLIAAIAHRHPDEAPGRRLLLAAARWRHSEPDLAESCLAHAVASGFASDLIDLCAAECDLSRLRYGACLARTATVWPRLDTTQRRHAAAIAEAAAIADGRLAVAIAVRRHADGVGDPATLARLEKLWRDCAAAGRLPAPADPIDQVFRDAAVASATPAIRRRFYGTEFAHHGSEYGTWVVEPRFAAAEFAYSVVWRRVPAREHLHHLTIAVQDANWGNRRRYWVDVLNSVLALRRLHVPSVGFAIAPPPGALSELRLAVVGDWCAVHLNGRRVLRTPVLVPTTQRRLYGYHLGQCRHAIMWSHWQYVDRKPAP